MPEHGMEVFVGHGDVFVVTRLSWLEAATVARKPRAEKRGKGRVLTSTIPLIPRQPGFVAGLATGTKRMCIDFERELRGSEQGEGQAEPHEGL